jgi:outer membrane biosynthesis protein TonB
MTFKDLISFLRTRKGTALSVALHLLVLGWGLFTFSARSVVAPPEDLVAVDIVSEDNVSKAKQGIKDGKKENPKPLAEKIGETKPVDDVVGKISNKPPVVADTAPPPTPKPEDKPVEKKPDPPKPVEKKPDPPKPVAEAKPKDEPKPDEKKPDEKKPDQPKVDPIADAIKKEEKKPPPPKPQVQAAQPAPPKPKADRVFDQSKIAALLDKRDPSRQAVTGEALNSNASLGTAHGRAADNSATWGAMFQSQVERCWKKPYGSLDAQKPQVSFDIRLKRDGTLEAMPVPEGTPANPYLRAYQDSAMRAIIACQPYNLPPTMFDEWKAFIPVFTDRNV